ISHCLFSRPGGFGPTLETEPTGAVLVRLASEQDHCDYDGTDNRFHNLTAFLGLPGEASAVTTLPEFLKYRNGRDVGSFTLKGVKPWENAQALLTPGDDLVARTFSLKKYLPDVRQSDRKATNLIGVEKLSGVKFTEGLRDKKPVLVVNPSVPTDSAKSVFR